MNFSQQSLSDGNPVYGARYKVIADPVHRMMTLDDAVLKIIDTPEFQRLRDVSAPVSHAAEIPKLLG